MTEQHGAVTEQHDPLNPNTRGYAPSPSEGSRVSSDGEKLYRRREMRSRAQALEVLFRVGIRDARADELLSGIEFPASLSRIYMHLGKRGIISRDFFTDLMGGSP